MSRNPLESLRGLPPHLSPINNSPDRNVLSIPAVQRDPAFAHHVPSTGVGPSQTPFSINMQGPVAPAPTSTVASDTPYPSTLHTRITSSLKWRVTEDQLAVLTTSFDDDPYPDSRTKLLLSERLGVTTVQVSKWFQHHRESRNRKGLFKPQYNRSRRTPHQVEVLESAFGQERYPNSERLKQLEQQLEGVTAKQIKLWFKHRRKRIHKRVRPSPPHSHTTMAIPAAAPFFVPVHSAPQQQHTPATSVAAATTAADAAVAYPPPMHYTALDQPQVPHGWPPPPPPPPTAPAPPPASPSVPRSAPPPPHTPAAIPQPALTPQYTFDPVTVQYLPYKPPMLLTHAPPPHSALASPLAATGVQHMSPLSINHTPLTQLDEMTLRGAQVAVNAPLTPPALARLAVLLNRPVEMLELWFAMHGAATSISQQQQERQLRPPQLSPHQQQQQAQHAQHPPQQQRQQQLMSQYASAGNDVQRVSVNEGATTQPLGSVTMAPVSSTAHYHAMTQNTHTGLTTRLSTVDLTAPQPGATAHTTATTGDHDINLASYSAQQKPSQQSVHASASSIPPHHPSYL